MFPPFLTPGMSGPQFFQTRMGQTFFEGTMPRVYRAVNRLTDALVGKREYQVVTIKSDDEKIQKDLDALGKEGWRLTHIESGRMFLERVVPSKEQG